VLALSAGLREAMIAHARAALPNEACGLLGGIVDGETRTVREVYRLTNADASPEHFSMLPEEQFAAVAAMRRKGLQIVGNFHSHPATPARPSEEDRRLAFDPALSYVIVSLAGGEPVIKSFRIDKRAGAATEEAVTEG